MAKTEGHSKIPWRTSKHAKTMVETVQGRSVGSMSGYSDNRLPDCGQGENFANAEFIVRCVNNHDKLVETCKGAKRVIRKMLRGEEVDITGKNVYSEILDAIKQAEEG